MMRQFAAFEMVTEYNAFDSAQDVLSVKCVHSDDVTKVDTMSLTNPHSSRFNSEPKNVHARSHSRQTASIKRASVLALITSKHNCANIRGRMAKLGVALVSF